MLSEVETRVGEHDFRLHRTMCGRVRMLVHRVGAVRGRLRDPISLLARARQRSDELAVRLERGLLRRYHSTETRVFAARAALASSARSRSEHLREVVRRADHGLRSALKATAWRNSTRVKELRSRLQALSPLAVLERGYSLTMTEDGRLVRSWADVEAGDAVRLRFAIGQARASIVSTSEKERK